MEIPFFERGTPENDPEFKEKMQCIKTRAKRSINDALKILEMEAPEWLNKNEEKNGKNNWTFNIIFMKNLKFIFLYSLY